MKLPEAASYVIIGAGVHGLSTAWHLAAALAVKHPGKDPGVVVLDKTGVGAGASGIACGVIRNNYFQPAMRELMAECVNVWESDPDAFSYHPVGYMQISPESMHADVATIYGQQQAIGYESTFVEGDADCRAYMRDIFDDWRAEGITSILHEKRGGYANNIASMKGLARKAEAAGARIVSGVTVTGFEQTNGSVTAVETDQGTIRAEYVVVAPGPWAVSFWDYLGLPMHISVKHNGARHDNVPMWTYWCLQEGTLGVDPNLQRTNDGSMPPVLHVDTDATLRSDLDGRVLCEGLWGIYYKPDFSFQGIQGGSTPYEVKKPMSDVAVDPYGHDSKEFQVREDFPEMWCSALAFCQSRFSGRFDLYRKGSSAGLGAFTPDSFPVFDEVRKNCYFIADSNHGYKMIAVGKFVAQEILGTKSALLEPFRFNRYETGKLHPVSNSPFPWS